MHPSMSSESLTTFRPAFERGKDERVGVGLFPGAFLPGKKSTGRTAAEADALEHLYVQAAAQPALQQSVHVAKAERREVQQQQLLEEAAQQRQQQLDAAQSQLSDAAAGELVVRHNLVVLRRRVKVKDEVLAHEASVQGSRGLRERERGRAWARVAPVDGPYAII